ncbi:hypothetical protein LYSHEL_23460 [Lysobacter helvus]|uniref:Periplasmic copper-binding protein NosD beta helix domain-containing protein n=2 Tax=Lysobacteraceae TaxID=32033 RepID=A0ABM7Q7E0_9GAMM|nr:MULTISPECIES: right-handed parallel beta-helix repeat-containing protein [Lysobacter]BCT93322.1 hypothetical protein LYSCAS_23460 [Lysobacter caseinilyticus]BCT96475.1 hypothetical protein LYSHEL_23460 [Lysobacter helvus]
MDTKTQQLDGLGRRTFLRNALLAGVPLALGGVAFGASAATVRRTPTLQSIYAPPARTRGATVLDVRKYGAFGDGVHDDTAAFNAAIKALPADGGTVTVPAGNYLINAVTSINLRSKMHLQLDPAATLVCKPNAEEKAYVIYAYKVSDVEISGGRVTGDRYNHLGTTGEWGHAVFVRGSQRVTVRDMLLSDCWGDGMSIGAALVFNGDPIPSEDVVVANVVCTNNRRQGLSIGRGNNVVIRDSEFSNSNGTAPECGIDIEPDDPGISNVVSIENCVLRGNKKYGLMAYKRSTNTSIRRCTIEKNGSCGIVTVGTNSMRIEANTIRLNSATGVYIQDGSNDCEITGNTFYGNYARNGIVDRVDFTQTGWTSKIERDILVKTMTTNVRVMSNFYK